ncbi:unnamed protein product [Effrenium voratum]|nr:unnamed protein product [Effrenium voratum]
MASARQKRRLAHEATGLVFVGIYSARRNFEKRQAVRDTWGRVLSSWNFRYRFFLGEASSGASSEERRMRREMEEHNDLVFLPVTEGYRMNSRKGLLFLEWIAQRAEAEFLLKTDDDVYLRLEPVFRQLQHRVPAQYAWAIFDYISPVPREPDDNFYNPEDGLPVPCVPALPAGRGTGAVHGCGASPGQSKPGGEAADDLRRRPLHRRPPPPAALRPTRAAALADAG